MSIGLMKLVATILDSRDCRMSPSPQEVLLGGAGYNIPIGRSLGTRPNIHTLSSPSTQSLLKKKGARFCGSRALR